MALDLCQNFVSAQYLENKLTEFHHILYMHSYFGLLLIIFCTRVMALDLRQNFDSAQHLDNKLVEFHQILYMHSY